MTVDDGAGVDVVDTAEDGADEDAADAEGGVEDDRYAELAVGLGVALGTPAAPCDIAEDAPPEPPEESPRPTATTAPAVPPAINTHPTANAAIVARPRPASETPTPGNAHP